MKISEKHVKELVVAGEKVGRDKDLEALLWDGFSFLDLRGAKQDLKQAELADTILQAKGQVGTNAADATAWLGAVRHAIEDQGFWKTVGISIFFGF